MEIAPTIGRVVLYRDFDLSDQFLPATICYVWSDNLVNLNVSDSNGNNFSKTSVPLFQGDASECPNMMCCWMPYQKAQAEREQTSQETQDADETGPETIQEDAPDQDYQGFRNQ